MSSNIIRKRKWDTDQLQKAVLVSTSYRQVIEKLKLIPAGGNYDQIKKYIKELDLDTKHFKGKGWSKGIFGLGKPHRSLESILVKNSDFQSFKLKNRLFKENLKIPKCEECGWNKKSLDGYLPLELDHINGDRHDNRIGNLRILCPNCHSLKPTHRGKNRKKK
jgi:5-methylcytosine-specific restriction endonuclease McrA